MNRQENNAERKPNIVESLFLGCTIQEVPKLLPGLLVVAALVALVILLTNYINKAIGISGLISYILMVIVIGMVIRNLVRMPIIFNPGINFCVRKLLRLGIIILGIRLSFFDVIRIGAWGVPIVLVCILVGLLVTVYFGRLLKVPERLATLIAVGTGICGASAIVATAPGIEAKDEEVSYAIANITIFGILAMAIYPFIVHTIFHNDMTMTGLFLGTAIHETSQVTGAGMIYNQTFNITEFPSTLDIAVVTKLVRNVMMVLIIPLMSFVYARRTGAFKNKKGGWVKKALQLFPLFIIGFLLLAVLRSIGDAGIQGSGLAFGLWSSTTWKSITADMNTWAGYILAAAMAGVGLSTSFKSMKGLGIKPFYVGFFAAIMVGLAALILVLVFSKFVSL